MNGLKRGPAPGDIVAGRYEVIRTLGTGGMGVVLLARHVEMDRQVAIKLIHQELAGHPLAGKRFEREMQAASRIAHPNTVEVYDFGATADGQLYLVMELIRGPSLRAEIDRVGAMPLERVVRIGGQVARALSAAHHEGIVHRDLKPDNVMLLERYGEKDVVKVLDFGLARFADDQRSRITATGVVLGTPAYMAPEQVRGGEIDPRTDIYALGVLLYEMVSARAPFEATTPMGLLYQHVHEAPPRLSEISAGVSPSPRLEALVERLLAKMPGDRPSSCEEIVGELEACVDDPERRVVRTPISLPAHSGVSDAATMTIEPERASTGLWVGVGVAVVLVLVAALAFSGVIGRGDAPEADAGGGAAGLLMAVGPEAGGAADAVDPGASTGDSGPVSRAEVDRYLGVGGAASAPPVPEGCRVHDRPTLVRLARAVRLLGGGRIGGNRPEDRQALRLLEPPSPGGRPAAELRLLRARALLHTGGEPEKARDEAAKAVERCSGFVQGWNTLGTALTKLGDRARAEEAYTTALTLAPAYGPPRFNRALLRIAERKLDGAIADLSELLSDDASYPHARLLRGRAYLLDGKVDAALADLGKETRQDPGSPDAWLLLGHARAMAGRSEQAQRAWCKAADLGNAEAKKLCRP